MSKDVHYNIDKLDKIGAQINWILGERSNGKSYQVKHKKGRNSYWNISTNYHANYKNKNEVIEEIIKSRNRRFILLRRLQEEIKPSRVIQYFQDIDISSITDGLYNTFEIYRGRIININYIVDIKIMDLNFKY